MKEKWRYVHSLFDDVVPATEVTHNRTKR